MENFFAIALWIIETPLPADMPLLPGCWAAKVHRSCRPPVRVMKSAENRASNHDAM
jgi:hypothetical protein